MITQLVISKTTEGKWKLAIFSARQCEEIQSADGWRELIELVTEKVKRGNNWEERSLS